MGQGSVFAFTVSVHAQNETQTPVRHIINYNLLVLRCVRVPHPVAVLERRVARGQQSIHRKETVVAAYKKTRSVRNVWSAREPGSICRI